MTALKASALSNPRFLERLSELSRFSDLVWFTATTVGLGFTLIAAFLFPFSPTGKFWAYAGLFIRGTLYLWAGEAARGRGGETLSKLFKLGLVAGIFELLVDWCLIHGISNGKLVYLTGNDVVLLGSPIWMPLAWACVIVELAYPALRLFVLCRRNLPARAATLTASLLSAMGAGITVGFYEYFAYRANWWKYEKANVMIGDFCPLYIPLGEFFMFLAVLPVAGAALSHDDRPIGSVVEGGVRFAVAIAAGYALAYLLLEFGRVP